MTWFFVFKRPIESFEITQQLRMLYSVPISKLIGQDKDRKVLKDKISIAFFLKLTLPWLLQYKRREW